MAGDLPTSPAAAATEGSAVALAFRCMTFGQCEVLFHNRPVRADI